MKVLFIESSEFTAWVSEYLPDASFEALQRELLDDPGKGAPIPGCGGIRKLRTPDPRRGKGKRGGIRVIYLVVPETNVIYLMDIYGKGEQEDLSADQKAVLKRLAAQLKKQAIRLINPDKSS
jgi:mRNA-degrading endonuclease RelE of RelBE toxin-antitoxin system